MEKLSVSLKTSKELLCLKEELRIEIIVYIFRPRVSLGGRPIDNDASSTIKCDI